MQADFDVLGCGILPLVSKEKQTAAVHRPLLHHDFILVATRWAKETFMGSWALPFYILRHVCNRVIDPLSRSFRFPCLVMLAFSEERNTQYGRSQPRNHPQPQGKKKRTNCSGDARRGHCEQHLRSCRNREGRERAARIHEREGTAHLAHGEMLIR